MSRIGDRRLTIPEGVEVIVEGNVVTVKKGNETLTTTVSPLVKIEINEGILETKQVKPSKEANIMQGTTNSLINGMLIGVSKGFAYRMIREMNAELKAQGYLTVAGRVSKKYYLERVYGINPAMEG